MTAGRDRGMSVRRKRRLCFTTLGIATSFVLLYLALDPDVYYRRYINTPACPPHGVVYAKGGGRLGNHMWEYAAAYVIAQRTGLRPLVHWDIRRAMDKVFVDLSVPAADILDCVIPGTRAGVWNKHAHSNLHNSPNATSIQIYSFWGPDYDGLVEIVVNHEPDVRREFKFHPHLVENAQEILRSARRSTETVFVGVHVRRTDYEHHLAAQYATTQATPSFYLRAMDEFRRKFKEAVFLVVSDDIEWCRLHLTGETDDVVLVQGTAAEDMATVSACNHTIIDYGTFGEWISMFAGGETIVYDLREFDDHTSNLAALKHWKFMR